MMDHIGDLNLQQQGDGTTVKKVQRNALGVRLGWMIRTKRVYERPETDDGYRVLVDRLWPRGLTKERAGVDEWLREAGPSDDLRRWFHDNPEKWDEFKASYRENSGPRGRSWTR